MSWRLLRLIVFFLKINLDIIYINIVELYNVYTCTVSVYKKPCCIISLLHFFKLLSITFKHVSAISSYRDGCRNLGKETELNEMPESQMVPKRSIIVYHDKACTNKTHTLFIFFYLKTIFNM